MDMVTLALQRTNGRVLKRSRRRDFVHGGDGQEQDGTGNTGVHGEYIYIYIVPYADLPNMLMGV